MKIVRPGQTSRTIKKLTQRSLNVNRGINKVPSGKVLIKKELT